MVDSADTLREAVKDVGVKRVAAALGVSTSLVYKWCERPNNADGSPGSGTPNPLDRLALLIEVSGDDRPVRWLAEASGGFFVRNPSARPATGLGLLRQTQVIVREFADLLESIEESLTDGRIEPTEAGDIRREWEQLKSAGEMLVVSCERRAGVARKGARSPRRAASE
ncbi:MAG TPA: hypothetical protein PK280_06070 [Planctomycetota bacterium]|nr:hypothetical protein [Planctomycetota bacterium]